MKERIGQYQFSDNQIDQLATAGIKADTRKGFTASQYIQMAQLGILKREDKTALIDGRVEHTKPLTRIQQNRVSKAARALGKALSPETEISVHSTIRLDDHTAVDPDIAVLTPEASQDAKNLPGPEGILLIIEVSEHLPRANERQTIRRYAEAGIPETWLMVIETGEVQVHWNPSPDGYTEIKLFSPTEKLSPQGIPQLSTTATELLN